ncbi:MAG: hypothetical protein BGO14_08395 [Chlamydiales bacterium 38-26]|nr:MAG: hypothetical protein BGO14_08395 [Chlamydiales bacterium 38-26]
MLWKTLKKSKKRILESLDAQLAQIGSSDDLDSLVEEKLEGFMQNLRIQIPMGAMLFTPALSEKIKALVREGLLKMLPDLKKKVIERVSREIQVEKVLLDLLKPEIFKVLIFNALLGLVVGFVGALINR